MTDLVELICSRHSVRSFTGDAVSAGDMEKMLRAGMAAPSAVNTQPWSFIAITDRNTLAKLGETLPYAKMLKDAGAAIVVCGLPKKKALGESYWVEDCSAASQNILLCAHALGLGAVWTAVYPDEEKISCVREILGIPRDAVPLNVIPIGVPCDDARPLDKYKGENVHFERW